MMEQKMIEFAVGRGMVYDDYLISKRGVAIFRCFDKNKKERFFEVIRWSPFIAQVYIKR